jgi:hypothetical protein
MLREVQAPAHEREAVAVDHDHVFHVHLAGFIRRQQLALLARPTHAELAVRARTMLHPEGDLPAALREVLLREEVSRRVIHLRVAVRDDDVRTLLAVRGSKLLLVLHVVLSGWRISSRLEVMPADLTNPARYARYRFPTAVIHHALWLMNRFKFSLRTGQEILLERGIHVSHETLREWNLKFAALIALEIQRRRAMPGRTWHPDEMRVVVRGSIMWL